MTTDKSVRHPRELSCRQAKKQFRNQSRIEPSAHEAGTARLQAHLLRCKRCASEARIDRLYQAILSGVGHTGAADAPDETWLGNLRARIENIDVSGSPGPEDSFVGFMWLAARQMVPAMVALVLLIVGATLLWHRAPGGPVTNDPVLMNQVVEYPQPTTDDVLGTLLAVEEKKNGK